ncbi:AbrB/MazE/SpoVT family DNA-binding domain-containing protein [Candidatus Nanohalovita haloferacivicina]
MVKVQEGSNGQRLITIPRELARAMGIKKGEELEFSVRDEKSLVLTKT